MRSVFFISNKNVKTESKMHLSLSINGSYENFQVGLFDKDTLIHQTIDTKQHTSAYLIPHIKHILDTNKTQLTDLKYIATNNGPGPFTTIRTIAASVNGLNFALNIPLIGVNSLIALLQEYETDEWPITVALLNAFTQDVYIGAQISQKITISCKNIEVALKEISNTISYTPIRFIGNGTALHREAILEHFGSHAYIPEPLPLECSLIHIAYAAQRAWHHNDFCYQLTPHYLKHLSYKKLITH